MNVHKFRIHFIEFTFEVCKYLSLGITGRYIKVAAKVVQVCANS